MKFSRFTRFSKTVSWLWLVSLAATVSVPLIWVALSTFKESNDIIGAPFKLPTSFNLENIIGAWEQADFGRLYINSAFITLIAVTGILIIYGFAAYAFAKMKFRGMAFLFILFIAGQLIPVQAILIPSALQMSAFGLSDTLLSLILQYLSWAPFAILFLRAAFLAVPQDLEDSARLDGANIVTILFRIVLPMTKSAFATIATIYSLWIWNDFLFPLIYIRSSELFTVPLGLAQFQGNFTTFWGYLVGAIFVSVGPPLLIYVLLSRQIQEKLSFAGIKG